MKIPQEFLDYKGQGENPDFSFLVAEFDKSVDLLLGINHKDVEAKIQSNEDELYKDLEPEALLTSYLDYHQIFCDLGKDKTIVDVGAGYCRGTLLSVLDSDYKVKCLSIEKVHERIEDARSTLNTQGMDTSWLIEADILDFNFILPESDAFYLYLPTGRIINRVLSLIIEQELVNKVIYAVESHGDLFDNLDFYPQLLIPQKCNLKTSLRRHHPRIRKYFTPKNMEALKSTYKKLKKADVLNLESLPLWILKFGHLSTKVRIKSKIAGGHKFREWETDLQYCHLTLYNNQLALELFKLNRILQLGTEDQIIKIVD